MHFIPDITQQLKETLIRLDNKFKSMCIEDTSNYNSTLAFINYIQNTLITPFSESEDIQQIQFNNVVRLQKKKNNSIHCLENCKNSNFNCVEFYVKAMLKKNKKDWYDFYDACIRDIDIHMYKKLEEEQEEQRNKKQEKHLNKKQEAHLNKKQEKQRINNSNTTKILTGTTIATLGLSALYYNRNRLTKTALNTYFKTDIKKYNTYKREHTGKQKRLTFKQWYYQEHPQPKGTRKNYFNRALDKVEQFGQTKTKRQTKNKLNVTQNQRGGNPTDIQNIITDG